MFFFCSNTEIAKRGQSVMAGAVPVAKPIDIDEAKPEIPPNPAGFKPLPYDVSYILPMG